MVTEWCEGNFQQNVLKLGCILINKVKNRINTSINKNKQFKTKSDKYHIANTTLRTVINLYKNVTQSYTCLIIKTNN